MGAKGDEANEPQPEARRHIEAHTAAKIRTFLFEVAEGVSNYRSLHSLTEQVEHQYHGRFLIELIQNAHDALLEIPEPDQPARIAIVLDLKDSTCGTLLVANDGQPFTQSNFERLSQLGQSDKDPQKSIGNKGLGFRSVLEVSRRPEVYSRASTTSSQFDGYCFAFEPEVIASLMGPMESLAAGGSVPGSPIAEGPIVDWAEALLGKFRARVQAAGAGWLRAETKYLSPYLLPVPRRHVESQAVKALEASGFMTVIRLPLRSIAAMKLVREHMEQLSPTTLLFLERVRVLELTSPLAATRTISRETTKATGALAHRIVRLTEGTKASRVYEMWTRQIPINNTTPEFRSAVRALPGRWPEIDDVSVSIAARKADAPEVGIFSIYLPTRIPTGSAVHVNAPFFGNMSRTDISFSDRFNSSLLNTVASLVAEVVRHHLAAKSIDEARMIIDMLAPFGSDLLASARWLQLVDSAFQRAGSSIDNEELVLAERGWRKLRATSLTPDASRTKLIDESLLRRHATFDIFHQGLSSRKGQIVALANSRVPPRGAFATTHQLAATVANIAEELHRKSGDWNAFWHDVALLLPHGQEALARHKVILGNDGAMHGASGAERVFFVPRQGTLDDSDIGSDGALVDIPTSLRSMVAFLHESITVYEPESRPAKQTPVRGYLASGLVTQFRVEAIFSGTLKEATPALPAKLQGPEAERCLAILRWALSMIRSAVARNRDSDAVMALLRPIPVPCSGGWYPMSEASFGAGWPATNGDLLASYLKELLGSQAKHARDRLLLPPNHPAWDGVGATSQDLLVRGGVFDGLKLETIRPEAWPSQFNASLYGLELPAQPPPGLDPSFWVEYKRHIESSVRGGFQSVQPYSVSTVHFFPNMADAQVPEPIQEALSLLILQSLPMWSHGLEPLTFSKRGGQFDRKSAISPLTYYLQTRAWLAVPAERNSISWSRPAERWHVPADVISRRSTHFAHLRALPYALARRLDTNPSLATRVHQLGMPYLNLHEETDDRRLLGELIAAIGSDAAPESNILLGQLRDAWHRFRPRTDQPSLPQLPVRSRGKPLERLDMSAGEVAYLPDLGTLAGELEQFGVRVLTLYPEDARALRDWFEAAYGNRVVRTSELRLVPRVDEAEWHGGSAELLSESALAWLAVPLLTIIAFYQQIRGIHSPAFRERLERIRELRVDMVGHIELVVMSGESEVMRTQVPAHWELSRKTLLVSESARHQPAAIAAALAQALDRDDLELPLRVLLGQQSRIDEPSENLSSALATLKISTEQLDSVRQHLRGDVGHTARMLQIFCEVATPGSDVSGLSSAESDEDLAKELGFIVTDAPAHDVVRIASESHNVFEFGSTVSRRFGQRFELPMWNAALERLGHQTLENGEWIQQLRAHLEESRGLVKRIAARLLLEARHFSFKEMMAQYEAMPANETNMGRSRWEIDFPAAMSLVAMLIEAWPGGGEMAKALRSSDSVAHLRDQLAALGVDFVSDPDERSRANNHVLEAVCEELDRLRQAWWFKTDVTSECGEWQSLRNDCVSLGRSAIGDMAYTQSLTEGDVFASLRENVPALRVPPRFFESFQSAVDLAALRTALRISEQDLSDVDTRLAEKRAEALRRRQLVTICGEEFDASEENRDRLWEFLQDRIDFERVAADAPINLAHVAALMPIAPGSARQHAEARPKPTNPQQRQPKAVDELVGFAGEICVFKMLQRQYGSDVVTASSWISSNSCYVFKDNLADDGAGCDFAFTAGGRSYKVEVKASAGDEPAFKLGSSEIALAMELAARRKGRRARFVLVHVKNALSATPEPVVLPNPYGPTGTDVFRIDQADARVHYRLRA